MLWWMPRWVRWGLPLAIIVSLAAFAVSARLDDASDAVDAARRINPWMLAAATLAQLASLGAQIQLMQVVLPAHHRPRFATMARVEAAATAVSHTVPGGTAAGTAVSYRLLTQDLRLPGAEVGFALAVRGIGSAVVLNVILWLALVVSVPVSGFQPGYSIAAVLGVALIGGLGLAVWLLIRLGDRAERSLARILARIPKVEPEQATRFLRRIAEQLQRLLQDRRLAAAAAAWASMYWLLNAASLWVFLAGVGYPVRLDELLVAYGVANVLAALPITPRGLGIVEGVLIPSMVGFGVPLAAATAAVIAWRLVSFWLPIPLGGLAYLSLKLGPSLDVEGAAEMAGETLRVTAEDTRAEMGDLRHWAREHGLDVHD